MHMRLGVCKCNTQVCRNSWKWVSTTLNLCNCFPTLVMATLCCPKLQIKHPYTCVSYILNCNPSYHWSTFHVPLISYSVHFPSTLLKFLWICYALHAGFNELQIYLVRVESKFPPIYSTCSSIGF